MRSSRPLQSSVSDEEKLRQSTPEKESGKRVTRRDGGSHTRREDTAASASIPPPSTPNTSETPGSPDTEVCKLETECSTDTAVDTSTRPVSLDDSGQGKGPNKPNETTEEQRSSTLYCSVEVGGHVTPALVDTGASRTIISYPFFKRLPRRVREKATPPDGTSFTSATGERLKYYGDVTLSVGIAGKLYPVDVSVMDMAHANMYIGIDFLQRHRGVLDARGKTLYLYDRVVPLANKPKALPIIARVAKAVTVPAKSSAKVQLRHDRPVPGARPLCVPVCSQPSGSGRVERPLGGRRARTTGS